jgi:hypothetical protein
MKTNPAGFTVAGALLATLLAAFLPASTFAALGKTADECAKIYGRPEGNATYDVTPPARIQYYYVWRDIYVRAQLVGRDVKDSRCGHVIYMRDPRGNLPIQALTEAEIESLLALNADGTKWERVPGGWKRSDNRALAVESKGTTNGVPDNALIVFTSDFYPKDSKSFAEVRASLLGHSTK